MIRPKINGRFLGVALTLVLLAGCDHNKQAQANSGTAAVAQDDSDLTGMAAGTANSTTPSKYPRATLVALPTPTPTPVAEAKPAPDDSGSVTTLTPPAEPVSSPTPTPTPAPAIKTIAASHQASSSSSARDSDGDMPRLAVNPSHPVVMTTPPPTGDDAREEDQVVVIETSLGSIVIALDTKAAPLTCQNFRKLVSNGFYNHTTFHRVIPHFVIQGGDPNSRGDDRSNYGQGGPGYTIPAEIGLGHNSGAVAMARLPDAVNPKRESNGSQFYICLVPCPTLDDNYTVFAHVIKGMDVAAKIAEQPRDAKDNPLSRIEMEASLESRDKALSETGN